MRSANLFGPLKGRCPYYALIGLTQASGLAGGFDFWGLRKISRITQLYIVNGIENFVQAGHRLVDVANFGQ